MEIRNPPILTAALFAGDRIEIDVVATVTVTDVLNPVEWAASVYKEWSLLWSSALIECAPTPRGPKSTKGVELVAARLVLPSR